ncbi:MAG: class I SAM-dependent methyltransferase [Pelagibacteraceae bacterium TMED124]|nr:MAG: class I SAM-dependent methyltransferase [Pelagibacteraceae bacterium TMED124]
MQKLSLKYLNLLDKENNKFLKLSKLKKFLLKRVCNNNSIYNYQFERLINTNFKKKKTNLNILDVGAGLCKYYPESVNNCKNNYYACDVKDVFRNFIEYRGINFIEVDLSKKQIDINDGFFDLIICSHMIEHLSNPELLLNELERILCPGGIIFFKTPNIKQVKWNFYDDFTHLRPYTQNSLLKAVESQNLTIMNCYTTTLYMDFFLGLMKKNILNPFNLVFLFFGLYCHFFRNDMKEIICLALKV